MPRRFRNIVLSSVVLFCAVVALNSGQSFAQKKGSPSPGKKAAPAAAEAAKPIDMHEFSPAEGVDVALMEVTRTAPTVVTVKWEYRNKTAKPQKLAGASKGWSDPYRLSWDTYLLGSDGTTKMPVMKDADGRPVAALNGRPNQLTIAVPPKQSVKVWAKYSVPAETNKVAVVIVGAEPFEGIDVKEPEPKPGN